MNLRKLLPLPLLLLPFLSCDRSDVAGEDASSSTVSLAPRLVTANGQALPRVDSILIRVTSADGSKVLYQKMVDWNKHADTIRGIPRNTPVFVRVEGIKAQPGGGTSVWWAGNANASFGETPNLEIQSFPVPVSIGDTTAPTLVSRTYDSTQSTLKVVWKLAPERSLRARIDGDTSTLSGDSAIWTRAWPDSGRLPVVAYFLDSIGNTVRDSFTAVRLEKIAAPVFSPATGTFLGDSAILRLATTTPLASIEYSMDSTTWKPYADSIVIRSSASLWARATKKGGSSSPVAKASYVFRVAPPAFDRPAGTYDSALTVALTCATKDAVIRYTLDGTEPNESSPLYTAPVRLTATTTIQAIASKPDRATSSVASANYVIDSLKMPVFSPIAGSYKDAQSVTISSVYKDAVIYYTTDGSIPTTSSKKYEAPILVTRDTTIRAIAVTAANATTAVAKASYQIGTIGIPTFTPTAGAYPSEQTVVLASTTPGAVIHYTLDGTAPDERSSIYTAPLKISATTTIRAIAMAEGWTNSTEASGTYFIGTVGAPVFSPKEGSYPGEQTVTITSATVGATIYYTTDSTTPTKASIRYTAPIVVGAGQTIKAIATLDGATSSTVVSATYSIGFAEAPLFSVAAGRYLEAQLVALSSKTPGATIHYTTNDSTPSTTSPIYVEPIKVSSKMTIKAFATAAGMSNSPVSSAAYQIGSEGTPTFSPPSGSYPTGQKVSLSSTTADASIHFTTDGTDPTPSSPKFTTPIDIPVGATIKAIAVSNGSASSVAVATYLIGSAEAPVSTPAPGSYPGPQNVTLASTTAGATIHYTLDGTTPSTSSAKYVAAIPVDTGLTLKAIAVAPGMANSAVSSGVYKIGTANPPTFTPPAGNYDGPVSIALTSTTPGSSIHYTLDGSDPTSSSSLFTGSIELTAGKTLKAIAVSATKGNSTVSSATYLVGKAASPTFTPSEGSFPTARGVKLASATSGAAIYYTTDGSTPTAASMPYSDSILVSSGVTIRAIAIAAGMAPSTATSATYTVGSAGTPNFSPASGSYPTSQKVVLSSSMKGATIYYTTDGTDPTTASNKYTDTLNVAIGQTIKAFAAAPGVASSSISSATYTIGKALSPAFDPIPKAYSSGQSVTLSCATPNAEIYYTLNDSTPTTASTRFTVPISVPTGRTIRAVAIAKGMANSDVAIGTYLIGTANPPSFQPATGSYTGPQWLSINSNNDGALVYYTTDGSTPTTSSNKFTGGFQLNSSDTIKAISVVEGKAPSIVAEARYVFTAATPAFSIGAGTFNTVQNVAITSGTPGATIYYTTDGTTPTTGSNVFTGAITVSSTQTIKAIAVAKGNLNSQVATAIYTINAASAPTFNPPGNTYTGTQYVNITSGTSNASIYYTTDGSTPTNSSPKYTAPVEVAKGMTLKAIATANGIVNSAVSSATYAITAAAPTFSPPAGSSDVPLNVTISSSTPGATIYYTTDGSTPTVADKNKYGGAIRVETGMTINAIAVASGTANSLASSATYVIGAVSSPAFDPAQGSYTGTQTVKLSSGTTGASIYYTTDGSAPTISKTLYQGPITVAASQTIRAIAILAGKSNSSVTEAKYTIQTIDPTFSVAGGTYDAPQTLILRGGNNPAGASIYYKIDNGTYVKYSTPISVTRGMTVTAFAKADGADSSEIVSATYVIGKASTPTFDLSTPAGTYTGGALVKLSGAGSIFYTTNGTTPTTKSTPYPSGGIPVASLTTIRAIAFVPGMDTSEVLSGTFSIKAETPVFEPAGGFFTTATSVAFKSLKPAAASILYSIDGGAFTTYTGNAFTVSKGGTIKAVATGTGILSSDTATTTFTIGTAGMPSITFNAGDSLVTIASNDANALFYKTGAAITYSKYDGAFKITGPTTVYAYATKTGAANSATETKSIGAADKPSITFNVSDSLLSITSTDADAFYYKTGAATTYTKYVNAFKITAATTVTAYATKTGAFNSATETRSIDTAAKPSITFNLSDSMVSITSTDADAFYYKTGAATTYTKYVNAFKITAATTVTAYATKVGALNSSTETKDITAAVAPTISFNAASSKVAIASDGSGTVYYKIGAGTFAAYSDSISISAPTTVYAYATKPGALNSVTKSLPITAAGAPTISFNAASSKVAIASDGSGTVYYKIGLEAFAAYSDSISIAAPTTVYAYATKPGALNSETKSLPITAAGAPTISFNATSSKVAIASDGSGTVYYKIGAGTFAAYSDSISISAPTIVYAYATKAGAFNSSTTDLTITAVETPTFSLDTATMTVTITSGTDGASLFYTTSDGTPTTAYPPGGVVVASGTILRALATKAGLFNSGIGSQLFAFETAEAPTFALDTATGTVTITSGTNGAKLVYTTSGGTPATDYPETGIVVASGTTVRAYAAKRGMANSSVATQGFVFPAPATTTGGGGTGSDPGTTTGP